MFGYLIHMPRFYKRFVSVFADICFLLLAFWLAMSLRYESWYQFEATKITFVILFVVGITLLVFVRLGLYRAIIRYLSNNALLAVFFGVTISALLLAASGFVAKAAIPRSVPFIYWCIAMLFVGGSRMLVRSYVHQIERKQKEKVIIYGAGSSGRQLATALARGAEYHPVAFVDDDHKKAGMIIEGLRVHLPSKLEGLIHEHSVETVLLAISSVSRSELAALLRFLEPLPAKIQKIPGMADVVSGKAQIEELQDVEIDDLLGRDSVAPKLHLLNACIAHKNVLVTGAGGSIGSELLRQILRQEPTQLLLYERSEFSLYSIDRELRALADGLNLQTRIIPLTGCIKDKDRIASVMKEFRVDTVYHAAAYKHVPLVEHNLVEGVSNNVLGTLHTAQAAIEAGVQTFVLISTDKAVRPTNAMGASKRFAELVLQGLNGEHAMRLCMVRFGNVLDSSGSVVPLFRQQIRNGGPVTVTHPDIIRYFMTIPEAAQLVIQAGSMGDGGDVFVLDMGEQVKIADLARKMIRLMGLEEKTDGNPSGDIEIQYTGLRPGEKLFEELLIGDDVQGTEHPRIFKAKEAFLPWHEIETLLGRLKQAIKQDDCEAVRALLLEAPLNYQPNNGIDDLVWKESQKKSTKRATVHLVETSSSKTSRPNA